MKGCKRNWEQKEKAYVIALQQSHLLHPSARKMHNGEIMSDDHPSGDKGLGYVGACTSFAV